MGLGLVIKELRKTLNISQSELAKGICSQSEISRIEKGISSPYVHTLLLISQKLGVDVEYFFSHIHNPQQEFIHEYKKNIREYIRKKDYKGVKKLIRKAETMPFFPVQLKNNFFFGIKEFVFITYQKKKNNVSKLCNKHLI